MFENPLFCFSRLAWTEAWRSKIDGAVYPVQVLLLQI
jgi:hypothetical protein